MSERRERGAGSDGRAAAVGCRGSGRFKLAGDW